MKKIWKIRRDEEAVSPVIATILMVAITVVLAAVLYIMVTGMTSGPSTLDSVGGTLNSVSNGWTFTCTSGTKDFPESSTYVQVVSETGALVTNRTLISAMDGSESANVTWYDNNADGKLNAGDSLFIDGGATGETVQSDDIFRISTSDTILYSRTLP